MKLQKVLLAGLALAMTIGAATTASAWECRKDSVEDLKIGASWKTLQEERWVRELETLQTEVEALGAEFIYQVSENDAMKQVTQIENLVQQDIDMLIVMSNEKETVGNALQAASEAGVFVCYYEATSGETYADFSGGNEEYSIGCQITQAIGDMGITGKVAYIYGDSTGGTGVMKFHDGMHDGMANSPDVEVVGEQWTTNWDPATAMGYAENWIAQYGEELTAILCMNDGMATGVSQALANAGLEGKVLICGQDCDLLAVQRIVAGTQVSTVLKSGVEYPKQFLQACLDYYFGETSLEDYEYTEVNNQGTTIPFFKYDGIIITADNVDEVIAQGVYTAEDIYGEQAVTE